MDAPDIPDECLNDNHDFDQTGRCERCNMDRVDTATGYDERRSGGAGSLRQPTTNGEYREQMRKLQDKSGK